VGGLDVALDDEDEPTNSSVIFCDYENNIA
jgi:hypothetical protein